MPIYTYECSKCKKTKDIIHKISETPNIICENCKIKMKKIINNYSYFRLKGSCWARDGYTKPK